MPMIRSLLILLLSTNLYAQYLTNQKITFLGVTTATSLVEGIEEANLYMKYYSGHSKDAIMSYEKNYHIFQATSQIGFIATGVTIALDSNMEIDKLASDLLVTGAIQWMLHDGILNLYRNKPWFWVSDFQREYNTGITDGAFNQPWIKITILVVAIGLNYLVYEVF